MSGSVYLLQPDESLIPMSESPYDSEELLHELLAKHPGLLAGEQMSNEARRWVLVKREASVESELDGAARWALDHLFLDQDAVPTLVEVKRSTDTRIRREVVGQMLDYAANAVAYWPIERLRSDFELTCREGGREAREELETLVGPGSDEDSFWISVKTNLQAGRIRLVFVADIVPPELLRIVEFLSEQMDPAEVFAVEVRQYRGESRRLLVPRVLGRRPEPTPVRKARNWDEPSFLMEIRQRAGEEAASVARHLVDWTRAAGLRLWWGKGAQDGSFYAMLDVDNVGHYVFAIWTYGKVEILFENMRRQAPFEDPALRLELLARLRSLNLGGWNPSDEAINRRPSFPLASLASPEKAQGFAIVCEWVIERVRTHASKSD